MYEASPSCKEFSTRCSAHVQQIGLKWLFDTQCTECVQRAKLFGLVLAGTNVLFRRLFGACMRSCSLNAVLDILFRPPSLRVQFVTENEKDEIMEKGRRPSKQLSTLLSSFHTGYAASTSQPEGSARYRK